MAKPTTVAAAAIKSARQGLLADQRHRCGGSLAGNESIESRSIASSSEMRCVVGMRASQIAGITARPSIVPAANATPTLNVPERGR